MLIHLKEWKKYKNFYENIQYKEIKRLEHGWHSLIHKVHIDDSIRSSKSSSSENSYLSGSGFGGGSSDGGSGGGGGGWNRF